LSVRASVPCVRVKLNDERVLVAGGWGDGGARKDAELYDPTTDQWTLSSAETSGMNNARWQHTATLLKSGKVLVAGGWGDNGARNDASAR
jgi:hypothetical protein